MEMPVIMFDKNEDYVVMTVDQVSETVLLGVPELIVM